MVHTLFQQGDLDYYELTPADLDGATLRKRVRARMLRVHPDKAEGSTKKKFRSTSGLRQTAMWLAAIP